MYEYNCLAAYTFFRNHIYNEDKQQVYLRRGFPLARMIPPHDWECLGAELINENKNGHYGQDLKTCDVKSAVYGQAFGWDFHYVSAIDKINQALELNYIFVTYSLNLKDIEVRVGTGEQFRDFFDKWRNQYADYSKKYPTKRFQRSIPFKAVKERGEIILNIEALTITHPSNTNKT